MLLVTAAAEKQDEDDLYSFMKPAVQLSAHCPVSRELDDFLQSKASSVQSLTDYPLIASAFVKANSTLPSSAAGMILSARRCKMMDKLFDKMVFLKCSRRISSSTLQVGAKFSIRFANIYVYKSIEQFLHNYTGYSPPFR